MIDRCPTCGSAKRNERGNICAQGTCMANVSRENEQCAGCPCDEECRDDWHTTPATEYEWAVARLRYELDTWVSAQSDLTTITSTVTALREENERLRAERERRPSRSTRAARLLAEKDAEIARLTSMLPKDDPVWFDNGWTSECRECHKTYPIHAEYCSHAEAMKDEPHES